MLLSKFYIHKNAKFMLTEWLTPHINTLSRGLFERKTFTFWLITRKFFFFFVFARPDIFEKCVHASYKGLFSVWIIMKMIKTAHTHHCLPRSDNKFPPDLWFPVMQSDTAGNKNYVGKGWGNINILVLLVFTFHLIPLLFPPGFKAKFSLFSEECEL